MIMHSDILVILKNLFSILPFLAIVTAGVGIYQYRIGQRWKKQEFIVKEVKEFRNDEINKLAMTLLDYKNPVIMVTNLYSVEDKLPKIQIRLDEAAFIKAIRIRKEGDEEFTDQEKIVRKVFDHFFENLAMFNHHIDAGIININDVKPYLLYWVSLTMVEMGSRKNKECQEQIVKYLTEFKFTNVLALHEKFHPEHKYLIPPGEQV
jgi:SMC interacting uncharacterized protein involved in chromosome segregation